MKLFVTSLLLALSSTAVAFTATAPKAASSSTQMMGAEAISGLTSNVETIFTSEQIDAILPHRYPFALVDKVVEYEEGKRAVGIKSVTKVSVLCVCFWRL